VVRKPVWLKPSYALAAFIWLAQSVHGVAQPTASVKDYEDQALREYHARKAEADAAKRAEERQEAVLRAKERQAGHTGAKSLPSTQPNNVGPTDEIAAELNRQILKCYVIPTAGYGAADIISVILIDFADDGSVADAQVVSNQGVTDGNQGYVRQMNDAAIRAVQRCSPYNLTWLRPGDVTPYFLPFDPNANRKQPM